MPQHAPQGLQLIPQGLPARADIIADSGDTGLLSDLPVELLHAEILRRQDAPYKPTCGTTGEKGTYNMLGHVFALFLILVLSTLGQSIEEPISNTS